jgi:hypothetical protein
MRREWVMLFLVAGTACPLFAATQVTIAQLQQILDAERGKPDGKVAKQLSDFELTERVSSARLAQWLAEFPGGRTRETLTALADASAFLVLPAADIPSAPVPDATEQQQILSRAIGYAAKSLSRLPNFYAIRETTHFEDTPPQQTFVQSSASGSRWGRPASMENLPAGQSAYEPLHKTGTYSAEVRYRDGFEVNDPRGHKHPDEEAAGLTTRGEFGPILFVVLRDCGNGKLLWSHWEQGAGGPGAVFAYYVPQTASHYMVQVPGAKSIRQVFPAYHGEIAIDPANGTILRVTVISDMAPPYQSVQASILVEYAPVTIGERTYICPVKGVALSKMPVDLSDQGLRTSSVQTRLNEVEFREYHLFRGDARIVTNAASGSDAAPAASPATTALAGTPQ